MSAFWLVIGVLYIVLIIPIFALVLLWGAKLVEKPLYKFFDWRWASADAKVVLRNGNRLVFVRGPNKRAHVWWDVFVAIGQSVGLGLLVAVTVYGLNPLVKVIFEVTWPNYTFGNGFHAITLAVIFVLVTIMNAVYVPIVYWLSEWKRSRTRYVATIATFYIYSPIPTLAGLFIPQSKPNYSDNDSDHLREVEAKADPEDLGGKPTGWLQEIWLQYLARYGVLTLMFASSFRGPRGTSAANIAFAMDNAIALRNIMRLIVDLNEEVRNVRIALTRAQAETLMPPKGTDPKPYSRGVVANNVRQAQQAVDRVGLLRDEKVIDLATVQDPEICDFEAGTIDPKFNAISAALGDAIAEVDPALLNVSDDEDSVIKL